MVSVEFHVEIAGRVCYTSCVFDSAGLKFPDTFCHMLGFTNAHSEALRGI